MNSCLCLLLCSKLNIIRCGTILAYLIQMQSSNDREQTLEGCSNLKKTYPENDDDHEKTGSGKKRKQCFEDEHSHPKACRSGESNNCDLCIMLECTDYSNCSHFVHFKEPLTSTLDCVTLQFNEHIDSSMHPESADYLAGPLLEQMIEHFAQNHSRSMMITDDINNHDPKGNVVGKQPTETDNSGHKAECNPCKAFSHNKDLTELHNQPDSVKTEHLHPSSKNNKMTKDTKKRLIYSREFTTDEKLQARIQNIESVVKHSSKMNAKSLKPIIHNQILSAFGKAGLEIDKEELDKSAKANVYQKARQSMCKSVNCTSLCENLEEDFENYLALVNEANNFAKKQEIFVAFLFKTVLQIDDTNGYVLKPGLWRMQAIMPEIRPFFSFRLAMDQEPEYNEGEVVKYSFLKEMFYIKDLLIYYYNGCPTTSENTNAVKIDEVVADYRKYIYGLLQAKQYRNSSLYYFYKFGYKYQVAMKELDSSLITQTIFFLIAFAPHPNSFKSLHTNITAKESSNREVKEKLKKVKSPAYETFEIGIPPNYFFSEILNSNTTLQHDLYMVLKTFLDDIRRIKYNGMTKEEKMVISIIFRKEIWMVYPIGNNKVPVMRLTRTGVFEYFYNLIFEEFLDDTFIMPSNAITQSDSCR